MTRTFDEVASGVFVTRSANYATNSTVLVFGAQAILIDPSWQPAELVDIADWIQQQKLTVVGGFATHAHCDHLLWHPRFGDAPRWASAPVASIACESRNELVRELGPNWPAELAALVGLVSPLAAATLPWAGFPIEMVTHDAHAPGHTGLWLPDQAVLLAGDMLSDLELPLAEQTGVQEYLAGLNILAPLVSRAQVLVPGHGTPAMERTEPGSIAARFSADQNYWRELLATGESSDPRITLPEMAAAHAHHQSLVRPDQRSSTMASTSTGVPSGSSATPTADRA